MYTFSNRLKIGSIILMAIGLLGIGIGFVAVPSTVAEAKAMVASHDDGHGDSHAADAEHAVAADHGATEDHGASHDEHLLHQLQEQTLGSTLCGRVLFLYDRSWGFSLLWNPKGRSGRLVSFVI